jgi:hypothetical protein
MRMYNYMKLEYSEVLIATPCFGKGKYKPLPDLTTEYKRLSELRESLTSRSETTPVTDEKLRAEFNAFRTSIGEIYLNLLLSLATDTERAYMITSDFWQSCRVSIFSKELHPLKHYRASVMPVGGYGSLTRLFITMFKHVTGPWQDELAKEWGTKTWTEFLVQVIDTQKGIAAQELEYRNAANIVLQVGIGWAGMLLGVIGLLFGIAGAAASLVPLFFQKGG